MTQLSANWYLEGRQILHACAPGVRVRWAGAPHCDCGILAPRRVIRFWDWMTGAATPAAPVHDRRGLTLLAYDDLDR